MGKLIEQIYLKMLIQPQLDGYMAQFPSKDDAGLLLKSLITNNNKGIASMLFINPKNRWRK